MKKIITLSLTLLLASVWAQTNNSTSLSGKITDNETGEELIGANLTVYQAGVLINGTSTDFEGNYSLFLNPGSYNIEVSYIGYEPTKTNEVIVKAGQANKLNIQLSAGGGGLDLTEIVVTNCGPFKRRNNRSQRKAKRTNETDRLPTTNASALAADIPSVSDGAIKTTEEISKLPTKNIENLSATTAGLTQLKEGDAISVRGSRSSGTDIYVNGIRVSADAVSSAKKKKTKSLKSIASKIKKRPRAGQLTAGEWKDLDNWSFWDELMKDQQFATYQNFWGFYPEDRFELKLSDKAGRPLVNVKVNLLNTAKEVVWSTMSDNKGSACLWGNFYGGDDKQFQFQVLHSNGDTKIPAIPYSDGLNSVELEMPCVANKMIDVAFVVDVTGSMTDELRYLKSEISDVIDRAKTDELDVDLRTAAVYYAGETQTHVLKSSPLTEKSNKTIRFMKTSRRANGEQYEAVDQGLGLAIRDLDWNDEAMARIVFILLDAAPSNRSEVKESLHKMIQEAAGKGIKVIPVAASGTDKSAEFLLKFMAMGTNSTYTFLTNHSGIGHNHIAPEAASYNVETLNDLLVRLIIENAEYHSCEENNSLIPEMIKTEKEYTKTTQSETNEKLTKQIRLFPNPAQDHVNIELKKAADMLIISTIEGQIIARYPQIEAGQIRLQTSAWASGVYLVHFWTEDGYGLLKLVVVQGS